jgi:thiamine kinase-like enzyme
MTTLFNLNKDKETGVIYFSKEKIIRKFFNNSISKNYLSKEISGIKWYNKRLKVKKKSFTNILEKKNNYIDILPIKGVQQKFWKKTWQNEYRAKLVIDYYLDIWPKAHKVPSHGDLTFSNIIFDGDKIKIIDWENFNKNNVWGYDLCYFLISFILLPNINNDKNLINENDLYVFKKLWLQVFQNKDFRYLSNPIGFLKKNFKLMNNKKRNKNFFINKVSNEKIQQINKIIL